MISWTKQNSDDDPAAWQYYAWAHVELSKAPWFDVSHFQGTSRAGYVETSAILS